MKFSNRIILSHCLITLFLLTLISNAVFATSETHPSHISGRIEFSKDGKYITSASDKYSFIWEVNNGKLVARFPNKGRGSEVKFSPDNKYALISTFDLFGVYVISLKKILYRIPDNQFYFIDFSPSSKVIYLEQVKKNSYRFHLVDPVNKDSKIYALNNGEVIRTLSSAIENVIIKTANRPFNKSWVYLLYISQTGENKRLFIDLYNLESGKARRHITLPWNNRFLELNRVYLCDNKIFIFEFPQNESLDYVTIIDLASRKVSNLSLYSKQISRPLSYTPYCVSKSGTTVATAFSRSKSDLPQRVKIFDVKSRKVITNFTLDISQPVQSIDLCPEKNLLAVAYQTHFQKKYNNIEKLDGKIIIYDISSHKIVRRLKIE